MGNHHRGRLDGEGERAKDHFAILIRHHPYLALGAVAALGIATGSLFGSELGRIALLVSAGYGAHKLLDRAAGAGGLRRRLMAELALLTDNADDGRSAELVTD